ncbi:hypothetical protein BRC81_10885 [Halobacteriales archaeon QS_1_68_20]|nr:MAG: hypothetical protein BRC81_10885 [Halobacteriales archaeon QS_1_68_20]
MRTTPLSVVLVALLVVSVPAGIGAADGTSARSHGDGLADVMVDDLVLGEPEQVIGPMRAAGYDEDVDEVVVEIDVSVLEDHGVDVSDAAVDVSDADVVDASLEAATVEDGVVELVFAPENTGFAVDGVRLTGLDTSSATPATGVEFDVDFSEGEGDTRSFDLVDPEQVTPTLSSRHLYLDRGSQSLTLEGIQPASETVTVEVDVTALEAHDVGVDGLDADASAGGATVSETAVEAGTVTVVLSPAEDAALVDVRIELTGFDTPDVDGEDRVHAAAVEYEVHVEGSAGDPVEVEPFDVRAELPTPHPHDDPPGGDDGETDAPETPTDRTETGAPLGLAVPVAAVVLAARLVDRRR